MRSVMRVVFGHSESGVPDCVYLYIRVGTGLLRCVRGGGGALGGTTDPPFARDFDFVAVSLSGGPRSLGSSRGENPMIESRRSCLVQVVVTPVPAKRRESH